MTNRKQNRPNDLQLARRRPDRDEPSADCIDENGCSDRFVALGLPDVFSVRDALQEWSCYLCRATIVPGDRYLCVAGLFRLCVSCVHEIWHGGRT